MCRSTNGDELYADTLVIEFMGVEFNRDLDLISYGKGAQFRSFLGDYLDLLPVSCYVLFPCSDLLGYLIVIGHKEGMTFRQFVIELIEIVIDHTLHRETRCDLGDGLLDILYPLRTVTLGVLRIVQRNDLLLKHGVDSSGIELILVRLVLIGAMLGECPACTFYIAFIPPSVFDGEVKYTVHLRFLTGRTGSLQRTGRSIEPDIHTGY